MRAVVVLPTYNEAANIERLLHLLLERPSRPDVLVVDDGSPDGTGDVVRALAAGEPRIDLLERAGKHGLGAAYVAGFGRALAGGYGAVVQMDADFSHAPADVDLLLATLDRADLVIGSRYVPGGGVAEWPLHRLLLSRAGNTYARMCVRVPVRDLTGGFKAWRAELLRRIDMSALRCEGYAFQVEMTARAVAAGARVKEVPITFRDRVAGTSKMDRAIALEALRVLPSLRAVARRS